MISKNLTTLALLVGCLYGGTATADLDISKALEYTTEAVRVGRDAKALGEQAALALKHIQAARTAHTGHPELLKQINQGEEDLRSALQHASKYNTERALHDTADAELHLRAADTAARRLEALQAKPNWPIVR